MTLPPKVGGLRSPPAHRRNRRCLRRQKLAVRAVGRSLRLNRVLLCRWWRWSARCVSLQTPAKKNFSRNLNMLASAVGNPRFKKKKNVDSASCVDNVLFLGTRHRLRRFKRVHRCARPLSLKEKTIHITSH
jgi:hypothetical protein